MKNPNRTITLLGIGTSISLLGDTTLYTVLPHPSVASQAGLSLAMVGILLGANRAVRLILNGPVGVLYDRMPRRPLLVASLALGSISSIFYAAGSGLWPLLAGRILWGVSWSLLWIGGNAVVLDISNREERGRLSGRYQMWFSIGIGLSSFLGGLFSDLFGFRMTQWISVLLVGLAALVWFFLLPETRLDDRRQVGVDHGRANRIPLPWGIVFAGAFAVFWARFISWGILAATAILWLSNLIGEGLPLAGAYLPIATLTGVYTAIAMLTSTVMAPVSGSLSDAIGRRWPVVALASLVGGAGICMMSANSLLPALTGAMLVPAFSGSVETLVPAIVGDCIADRARGRGLGIIYTVGDLGATLGPVIALGILDAGRVTLGVIYQFCALLLGLVAFFAWFQARQRTALRYVS